MAPLGQPAGPTRVGVDGLHDRFEPPPDTAHP